MPGRHILAARPSSQASIRVDDLPFRALGDWLRDEAKAGADTSELRIVGLSYDAGRNLERLPALAPPEPSLPDVVFASYPAYLEGLSDRGPFILKSRDDASADALIEALRENERLPSGAFPATLEERTDRATYSAGIEAVLEAIRAGEMYQANVARRLEADMDASLAPALYMRMRESNPASFGTLWCLGEESWIASSSPECLFTYDPEGRSAHSYPIKGTRPRGETPEQDARLARLLKADPKEAAEHVMIVDLVRNDLGRVCESGSVGVRELGAIMQLPTVHHLVSDVAGRLAEGADVVDLLLALFPGGSITGAPKIAAMKKIEEIESVRRGFYTGSVGVLEPSGKAAFNILIRTCVAHRGRLYYQTGGGIVADSTADREWEETQEKAYALTRLLAEPSCLGSS